jgi:hypothetical protein
MAEPPNEGGRQFGTIDGLTSQTEGYFTTPKSSHRVSGRQALDAALELAGEGWPVFPLRSNKAPACQRGFKRATRDPAEVRSLWATAFAPPVLVGVATGAVSGVAILDLDPRHSEMVDWLDLNAQRLPLTQLRVTRSGGSHLAFGYREGLCSSQGVIELGVDIRSDRGYIVDWPSAGFPVYRPDVFAPWPEWLDEQLQAGYERLEAEKLERRKQRAAERHKLNGGTASAQPTTPTEWIAATIRQDLDELHAELAGTPAGRRHDVLVRGLFPIAQVMHYDVLDRETVHASMHSACTKNGWCPTWQDEFEYQFNNCLEEGDRERRYFREWIPAEVWLAQDEAARRKYAERDIPIEPQRKARAAA